MGSFSNDRITIHNLRNLTYSSLVGIAVDKQGNLWITQHGASLLSEFNPLTHYFRAISTSIPPLQASLPYFVQIDSLNIVWFGEHYGNAIGKFDPETNTMVEYGIPSRITAEGNVSGDLTVSISQEGTPWFTETDTGKIGAVNTSSPVNLSLQTSYQMSEINVGNDSKASIGFLISNPTGLNVSLTSSIGNLTGNFTAQFSTASGSRTFNTNMTISNFGSPNGIYFLTISAASEQVTVSKIIEIRAG